MRGTDVCSRRERFLETEKGTEKQVQICSIINYSSKLKARQVGGAICKAHAKQLEQNKAPLRAHTPKYEVIVQHKMKSNSFHGCFRVD